MQIVSNIALISINETLIVQLISFLIFLFVINRLMFRPLRRVMGERDAFIEQMRRDISDTQKEVLDYSRRVDEERNAIRAEAFSLNKQLENEGREIAEQIIGSVEKEIAGLREAEMKQINLQIQAVREETLAQSEKLALAMMERILERRLL